MLLKLENYYNIVSTNLIVLIIVLPVLSWNLEASAQNSTTLNGYYCKTISAEAVNDTSECIKNANGTAGCLGQVCVWAAQKKCTKQSLPTRLCKYTCTPIEVPENITFKKVVPQSTTYGQMGCLLKNGTIGVIGAGCIIGVVAIFLGAEFETFGASTSLGITIGAAVIVKCGETAGNAFIDWWNNPCCHTYCMRKGKGTPSTEKIESCQ
ncbi:MAG: hypothetical protein LBE18_09395 [Planctomycetaceae bacterium]|jgi:hypothetical protein|nr:hypothetical protein [Planctomycetaceae bacterium]